MMITIKLVALSIIVCTLSELSSCQNVVPYRQTINEGTSVDTVIEVKVTSEPSPNRIQINLCAESDCLERALHFDIRFNFYGTRYVVINSRIDGRFDFRQRTVSHKFPFEPSTPFTVRIYPEEDLYRIKAVGDDGSTAEYKFSYLHRMGFESFNIVYVDGAVAKLDVNVYQPVPYLQHLQPMTVGTEVSVTGTPVDDPKKILVNLCGKGGCGTDIGLRFGIRFDSIHGKNVVVMNYKNGTKWNRATSVKSTDFPYKGGEEFTIRIAASKDRYKIIGTSGGSTAMYEILYYQFPVEDYSTLRIWGDVPSVSVEVSSLNFAASAL